MKIANRAVVDIISIVNTEEEVAAAAFRETTIVVVFMAVAVADISSTSSNTVLDSCPARPPRKGVKSMWATSHGTQDGASSRITSVNVEKSNDRRWPRGAMVGRKDLVSFGSVPRQMPGMQLGR